jgi:hypothetical protein
MEQKRFESWLKKLRSAWENRSPEAAADLFAGDVKFWETPFDSPIRDKAAIKRVWLEVPRFHKNIKVQTKILVVQGPLCIVQWKAAFTRVGSGKKAELAGVYKIVLNEEGLCTEFRQWFNSK